MTIFSEDVDNDNIQEMMTTRNVFIANLAISDILLCLFTIPLALVDILTAYWNFGQDMVGNQLLSSRSIEIYVMIVIICIEYNAAVDHTVLVELGTTPVQTFLLTQFLENQKKTKVQQFKNTEKQ